MSGCYAVFHKQLGDLVLLEPTLSLLREHHGGPVRMITRGGHADLLKLMPGVEAMRGPSLAPAGNLYCLDSLSKSAFRSLIAPVANRRLVVPERTELHWYHKWLFPPVTNPELGESYVAEFFWKNASASPSGTFRPPRLDHPPDEWAPPGVGAKKYVLINPVSGWRQKLWTAQGWLELLASIRELGPFLITGGSAPWQLEHCREIVTGSGVESLVGRTSLREFLWLCANARAVISVEGVASHIAAATGVPCLTLFGPSNINNWHRPGPGREILQAPASSDGVRRMKSLDPSEVVRVAEALLRA